VVWIAVNGRTFAMEAIAKCRLGQLGISWACAIFEFIVAQGSISFP